MRALIAGNWKMHGTAAALGEIRALAGRLAEAPPGCDLLICPPATLLARAVEAAEGRIPIGGQDCHAEASGAYTGDVSAEMLKDAGAVAVIVGHSERRYYHGETDAQVAAKAAAAHRAGLTAIVCVGESEAERDAGRAFDVVGAQIAASVPEASRAAATAVAYEPVWAIGTGRTPTLDEIARMHAHIRARLKARLGGEGAGVRILYGGSVKPANAADILGVAEVAGALVGGASLKADDFAAIVSAAPSKV
jgi:triosephosphate isomerase